MKNEYLTYLRSLLIKKTDLVSLVFFITNKCNLRCSHCFLWKGLDKPEHELSLEEIDKVSKSMGTLLSLSLTGGEPFLREDISEIAELFYRNNNLKHLSIPTNGLLGDKIVENVNKILSKCPKLSLNLAISLDGLENTHDKIRGLSGCFKKAIETYSKIKKISEKSKKLTVEIITTMTSNNQHNLDKFYDFVIGELKPDSINFNIIRGDVKKKSSKKVDVKIYSKTIKRIQKSFLENSITGYDNFSFSEYTAALRMVEPKVIMKTLKENKYQSRCYAGMLNGVLYSNGDVFPCELLNRKIGNVRDFDYDFKKLWSSKEIKNIRKYIKDTKCFCIHPCNLTVNTLFNVKYIPKLAYYGSRLKLRKLIK
ncbi:MAG: radical SAM protein [Nanoarchaeota archaeon]|nr:radical SAM protein [Nanoarchaeota archaeon]